MIGMMAKHSLNYKTMSKTYFVFDVESIGLHGEAFAVGFVVVNELGKELVAECYASHVEKSRGNPESHAWVSKNILPITPTHGSDYRIRDAFWLAWKGWESTGAIMVADCAWPVEARFLIQCIEDNHAGREFQGPYPLHDLASILLAKGFDPLTKFPRLDTELPEHDPLCDARQSARILIAALNNTLEKP